MWLLSSRVLLCCCCFVLINILLLLLLPNGANGQLTKRCHSLEWKDGNMAIDADETDLYVCPLAAWCYWLRAVAPLKGDGAGYGVAILKNGMIEFSSTACYNKVPK